MCVRVRGLKRPDKHSRDVNCGPNLIRLIAKGYAQIVSDVSVDVLDVTEVYNIQVDILDLHV